MELQNNLSAKTERPKSYSYVVCQLKRSVCIESNNTLPNQSLISLGKDAKGLILNFKKRRAFAIPLVDIKIPSETACEFSPQTLSFPFWIDSFGFVIDPLGKKIHLISEFENAQNVQNVHNVVNGVLNGEKEKGEKIETGKEIHGLKIVPNLGLERIDFSRNFRSGKLLPFGVHLFDYFYPLQYGGSLNISGRESKIKRKMCWELVKRILSRNKALKNQKITANKIEKSKTLVIYAALGMKECHFSEMCKTFSNGNYNLKDLLIINGGKEVDFGNQILCPFSAVKIGKSLSELGENVVLFLDDLSWHGKTYIETIEEVIGEKYVSNMYGGLFSNCGISCNENGTGSLSIISLSSENMDTKKTRVSFAPSADIRSFVDRTVTIDNGNIDTTNIAINSMKPSVPKTHLEVITRISNYLSEKRKTSNNIETHRKIGLEQSDRRGLNTKLVRQEKLIELLKNFDNSHLGINPSESFFVLSSFCCTAVIDFPSLENVLKSEEEIVLALRKIERIALEGKIEIEKENRDLEKFYLEVKERVSEGKYIGKDLIGRCGIFAKEILRSKDYLRGRGLYSK